MSDSEVACATVGMNMIPTKLVVFVLAGRPGRTVRGPLRWHVPHGVGPSSSTS